MVADTPWPKYNENLVRDDELVLPVQINGKKRADITVAVDASQDEIITAVLALDVVQGYLNGANPRKIIVVPKRIVNIVV
jgi:leucyl-tRNA synthetase